MLFEIFLLRWYHVNEHGKKSKKLKKIVKKKQKKKKKQNNNNKKWSRDIVDWYLSPKFDIYLTNSEKTGLADGPTTTDNGRRKPTP